MRDVSCRKRILRLFRTLAESTLDIDRGRVEKADMDFRQLQAFEAVVEHRSFTRAAEALFLTQPAITRQIAALESSLKTRLFERMGRLVQLTPSGEKLHAYALEIMRLSMEAERVVGEVETGIAGRLAVGANSTTATYFLPQRLRRFRESFPGIELSVHTGASAKVAEMALGGLVDVGIVTGYKEQPGVVAIPLTEFATGVVVYPEHELAIRKDGESESIRAEQLSEFSLILMERGTNLRNYVDRLLLSVGAGQRVTMELDSVEAIKKMIEARHGISLLPLVSVEAEVESGRLVVLKLAEEPHSQRRVTAIYRQDKYLTAALKSFLEILQSVSA